jgi:hypothetical protein
MTAFQRDIQALLSCVLLALLIPACASSINKRSGESVTVQARSFANSSYEDVFEAFQMALRDEGYVVKDSDEESGRIVAVLEKGDPFADATRSVLIQGGGDSYSSADSLVGEEREVRVNLEPSPNQNIEAHMKIQQVVVYEYGGRRDSPVTDSDVYREIFEKVRAKIEGRRIPGRT